MESASSLIWELLPDKISRPSLKHDPFWENYELQAKNASIHVAILSKPYLELVLDCSKTIESRFSIHRRLPYKRVKQGDIILLKQSSGPIKGIGLVSKVWFYELANGTLEYIKKQFGNELQIQDQEFWEKYTRSAYATLMRLECVRRIDPIIYSKRDQRAWVTFDPT